MLGRGVPVLNCTDSGPKFMEKETKSEATVPRIRMTHNMKKANNRHNKQHDALADSLRRIAKSIRETSKRKGFAYLLSKDVARAFDDEAINQDSLQKWNTRK